MTKPADPTSNPPPRALRADARQNHELIVAAATKAFKEAGPDASLKAIAKEAGVGIGTLYRRFPSREALIEAIYRSETERLAMSADHLLADHPPDLALRAWMDEFLDYTEVNRGIAEMLKAELGANSSLSASTGELLTDAVTRLMAAGVESGTVRSDIDPSNVLQALGGITFIAGEPDQRKDAERLVGLLMDGLRQSAE